VKKQEENEGILAPYRILDLTDEKGFLCGKMFGDLGADVIKIERPGGDPSRNIPPFYYDDPDPEKSLYWFAFNTSKRGITLNIELPEGQELFRKLVKTADFVLESFPPGKMHEFDLDYATLADINPRIIMTSITHFGQSGPYKDYRGSDIVAWAMSGYAKITGDMDHPPLRVPLDQAYRFASAHAAVATMIAHYYRLISGEGQHVDVSVYECAVRANFQEPVFWECTRRLRPRASGFWHGEHILTRVIWRCQNGWVVRPFTGGHIGARENRALVQWMDEEGMASTTLKNVDWPSVDARTISQSEIESLQEPIGQFFLKHTKRELEDGALKRGIRLSAVANTEDLLRNEQFVATNYWVKLNHPELDDVITYPGAFFRSDEIIVKIRRRAPLIGEHNEQIYERELGLSKREILALKRKNIV